MNLYKLHTDPGSLNHHDKMMERDPGMMLKAYKDRPEKLRKYKKYFLGTPQLAYYFAFYVQERFPDIEKVIATEAPLSIKYTRTVLKGERFKEAEDVIKRRPRWIRNYKTAIGVENGFKLWQEDQ